MTGRRGKVHDGKRGLEREVKKKKSAAMKVTADLLGENIIFLQLGNRLKQYFRFLCLKTAYRDCCFQT